ncbi:MAG: Tex family protein [Chloroflexota bacterium]
MTTTPTYSYDDAIAAELGIRRQQAGATIALLDDGNTVPFIARYRKEATGTLDEEQIRLVESSLKRLRTLDERRDTIVSGITEQGKLTPELGKQISEATTMTALEDLYAPYKPRRRTRAGIAREKGLEPLALLIVAQPTGSQTADRYAASFLNKEVTSAEEALAGARDIVAEMISDHAGVRQALRNRAAKNSLLRTEKSDKAADDKEVYQLYYEFELPVARLRPHQVLAINRGEEEQVLRVSVLISETDTLLAMRTAFRPNQQSPLAGELATAMDDAAKRLLGPAIERDVRRMLTEQAEAQAISVFASNLRALLNQPPLAGHVVMGIDPGFRTGCKVAVMDATSRLVATETIYPHPPQKKADAARATLEKLIEEHQVTLIAIGNGTASRETEQLIAGLTRELDEVHYVIVNEAGASVYSASKLARAELPDLDVAMRGAVSIGRRLQDPLAELVKIDPQSIGVGMYQHDVDQKQLSETLGTVVESVVNQVGVEVNSASPALLTYVSGIGPRLAEQMVAHRDAEGPFPSRAALKDVSGLGPKSFEQAAGFLRVHDSQEPFDDSAIHPESYALAEAILKLAGLSPQSNPADRQSKLDNLLSTSSWEQLADKLGTGVPTLQDIWEQLLRPGRDPRADLPLPILRSDVLSMDDLREGMELKGTVRNVVDFGVFLDIGVKQDGLLHRSQIPRSEALQVGDVITVRILRIDTERGRIGLGWV